MVGSVLCALAHPILADLHYLGGFIVRQILIVCFLILGSSSVVAQITDPAQRKDWYYLQTLSTQFEDFRQCSPLPTEKVEWQRYWPIYYKKIDELVTEIEAYVVKYLSRAGASETPLGFKYRVWDTTLAVGKRNSKKKSPEECIVIRGVEQ